MSPRMAAIIIAVFCLGAVVACFLLMGSIGAEFAVVGLVVTVFVGALGIVWPALAKNKANKAGQNPTRGPGSNRKD